MPENKPSEIISRIIPPAVMIPFILFTCAIIILGIVFYKSQRNRIYSEQETNLKAIATLKINQIVNWKKERIGDAAVIRDNSSMAQSVKQYFRNNDNVQISLWLKKWMNSVNSAYDYSEVLLLDTSLKVRLSAASDTVVGESIKNSLKEVMNNGKIIFSEFHRSKTYNRIHIDILIPVYDPDIESKIEGIIILRIDPSKSLFPLIQSWPTQSRSAETLLLRQEGDSILYLNELRHKENTALILKLPLNKPGLLASLAIKRLNGIHEGTDYRDVPVIGFVSDIPGSGWFMVSKIDKEEVLAPLKRYFIITIILVLLLIIINALFFGFWIWDQRVSDIKRQLEIERAAHEMKLRLVKTEDLYKSLFENMLNGFAYCRMLYDKGKPYDFIYLKVNSAFEKQTGLKNVEGLKVSEVIPGFLVSEPELIHKYGSVAMTGKPETFEILLESLKMWFSVSVYCPEKDYFVSVFDVITDRKAFEAALQDERNLLRTLIDLLPAPIFVKDSDSRFIMANSACATFMGATGSQDLIGKTDLDFYPHELASVFRSEELSVLSGVPLINKEEGSYSPSGSPRNLLTTKIPLKNAKDEIIGLAGTSIDITEQYTAYEKTRVSEAKFRGIFENSPLGKSITGLDGSMDVNEAFCKMLGYTHEEMLSLKWQEITHRDDVMVGEKVMADLMNGMVREARYEKRYMHKNGNTVWAELMTSLIRFDSGEPRYFITSINDITWRKQIEQERFRLMDMMDKSLNEIYIFGAETMKFEYVNQGALKNIGYSLAEMYNLTPLFIKPFMDGNVFRETLRALENKEKEVAVFETSHQRKDRSLYDVEVHLQYYPQYGNGVFVAIINDITERKKAQSAIERLNEELEERVFQRTAQLEAANKELEAFSYSVSHDLRAPLRAIHSFTTILREDYDALLDEEGKRICGIIETNTVNMGGLIDDLLSFSRIGRAELSRTKIDMTTLVKTVFNELTTCKEKEKIEFHVSELPPSFGDHSTLSLVWTNLISNAIKYSSKQEKPVLKVGFTEKENQIVYFIEDNGVGFEMKYYSKLFGVFQRLHSQKEFEGNGVGLAIVNRIVTRHKGKVWAEAQLNRGATFYFSLPI
jgi:PAS domain S-box-containing protein